MKRLFCLVAILIMVCTSAGAVDLNFLSDFELVQTVFGVMQQIDARSNSQGNTGMYQQLSQYDNETLQAYLDVAKGQLAIRFGTKVTETDWTQYTNAELVAMRDGINAVLDTRNASGSKNGYSYTDEILVYDANNIKVYVSDFSLDYSLKYTMTIYNNSSKEYMVYLSSLAVNGWDVLGSEAKTLSAGAKTKFGASAYRLDDIGVTALDQVKKLGFTFTIMDTNTGWTVYKTTTVEFK